MHYVLLFIQVYFGEWSTRVLGEQYGFFAELHVYVGLVVC